MTDIDWAEYFRLEELTALRIRNRIPPSEQDRRWFASNPKTDRGVPRIYRVRESIKSDHPVFALSLQKTTEWLTIIRRDYWWYAVAPKDERDFGPVVDCDEYARLRLRLIPGVDLRSDSGWVPQ